MLRIAIREGAGLFILYTSVAKFLQFREFFSVAKLNFTKLSPCHTFYIAHVDHSQKYFLRTFISRKLSNAKISRYTVNE